MNLLECLGFRVWDESLDGFGVVTNIRFKSDFIVGFHSHHVYDSVIEEIEYVCEEDIVHKRVVEDDESLILQPFTGFLDIYENGIFVGDVVRLSDVYGKYSNGDFEVVLNRKGCLVLEPTIDTDTGLPHVSMGINGVGKKTNPTLLLADYMTDIRVVGNIFEGVVWKR